MALQIFRTKPIASHNDNSDGLKRCLSKWDLAFLGVGAIIGTGIFVLTGIAAATQAGPAIVVFGKAEMVFIRAIGGNRNLAEGAKPCGTEAACLYLHILVIVGNSTFFIYHDYSDINLIGV